MQTALAETAEITPKPAHANRIVSLALHNFRNHVESFIEPSGAPVVLVGRNGAGKTNILEAISLLIPGRGLRKARLSEIDNHTTGQPWVVAADVTAGDTQAHIGTGRDDTVAGDSTDKRIVKIDGKRIRGQAELARRFAAVWLVPQMDQLFQESASSRRKFLDRLTYCFDAEHASRVNSYEYAMRERNRLLTSGVMDDGWLSALEQKMAEKTQEIAFSRMITVERLNNSIMMSKRSFPKARLEAVGQAETLALEGADAASVQGEIQALLKASRRRDAQAGRASGGAHKCEMKIYHIEKAAEAATCSTGEQKALLLSTVMAQVRACSVSGAALPVLLLDEVIAHLDEKRRAELFEEIIELGAQVWMTGTDSEMFLPLGGKAKFYKVDNATVSPV